MMMMLTLMIVMLTMILFFIMMLMLSFPCHMLRCATSSGSSSIATVGHTFTHHFSRNISSSSSTAPSQSSCSSSPLSSYSFQITSSLRNACERLRASIIKSAAASAGVSAKGVTGVNKNKKVEEREEGEID